MTNCDDELCSTNDEEKDFRVSGELDGIALGESENQFGEAGTSLQRIERFTMEFRGAFPFEIFPIRYP
jgi:hypothetical protein